MWTIEKKDLICKIVMVVNKKTHKLLIKAIQINIKTKKKNQIKRLISYN